MFHSLTGVAFQIDRWLDARLGRPYRMLLSIGLVADIIHRVLDAPGRVQTRAHLIGMALAVLMELALLIHQVGEMHERLGGGAEGGAA